MDITWTLHGHYMDITWTLHGHLQQIFDSFSCCLRRKMRFTMLKTR